MYSVVCNNCVESVCYQLESKVYVLKTCSNREDDIDEANNLFFHSAADFDIDDRGAR